MPVKSSKQYRFMQGIAHGMLPRRGKGPSREVAQEFIDATPKKKRKEFAKNINKKS
jgi:hypothetical protein